MTVETEGYQAQLSVKCGPTNSRGDKDWMWNLRGPDVATVVGHLQALVAFAPSVHGDLQQLQALEAAAAGFTVTPVDQAGAQLAAPSTAVLTPPSVATGVPIPIPLNTLDKGPCPVNGHARHYLRTGIGKNNKPFTAVFCNNTPECAAVFL